MAKRKDDAKRKTVRKPRKAKVARRPASSRAGLGKPSKVAKRVGLSAGPMPVSECVDHDLAERAIEKQGKGDAPTAQELGALRRIEKRRDEALRAEHYRTIPQRVWISMSGRQRRTIVDQAEKYNLPIGGATIDLAQLAKAMHDFLAANSAKLAAEDGGNGTLKDQKDRVALETQTLRNERERMDLGERRGTLIEKTDADADRLAIVKMFVGVLEIAGSELSSKLAGRKPADVRKIVEAYFNGRRCEIEAAADPGT